MITKAEVLKTADNARIELSDQEAELFTQQLKATLQLAQKLQEIDTDGVQPTINTVYMQNILREDIVEPSLPREEALSNAPDPQDGFFRVPKIMD